MKPAKRQKLEHHVSTNYSSAINTSSSAYYKLEKITFNHAKNYLEMINQLTATNFYVISTGDALFFSHDTISSAKININTGFPSIINRVSRCFDRINIPYTIQNAVTAQIDILSVKNIEQYRPEIEKAYSQPLNWYDEDEIKHIMEIEIANRTNCNFFSTTSGITVPLVSTKDSKYYERSNSPKYLYGSQKTDPISLYHFARVAHKLRP